MKLIDLSTRDFIDLVDSSSPAPGGGSASALISGLGVSLARMVGHLTTSKKRYLKLDADIQTKFENHLSHLLAIKEDLLILIDKDTFAFKRIMTAYKLPKEDKEARDLAIEEATLYAIEVPYRIAIISLKALELLPFILTHGNKLALSDIGVAALSLSAGIEGALYNVLINLPGISDEEIKSLYKNEYTAILKETYLLKDELINKVRSVLTA